MLENELLYDDGKHRFVFLGWEEREEEIVQTNQFLILDNEEGILLDPGGAHIFPRVLSNISEVIDPSKIRYIFYSHQDPDVTSGIALWLSVCENAHIYISSLWVRFLPHFGVYDARRIIPIPDGGMEIKLSSGNKLEILPAHFLHSVGNFNLYDPVAKILFSGDIGAAVFKKGERYRYVEDFDRHVALMEGFHKRYMVSNVAIKKWVEMVSTRKIEVMAPQHGAVFKGENVRKFLEWFKNLRCGIDELSSVYNK